VFKLDRPRRTRTHRRGIPVAITAMVVTAAGLLGSPRPAAAAPHAADCSVHGDGKLYCGNTPNAKLHWDPNYASPVSGIMQTAYSWFTCWQHGQVHPGHNDIWYWTEGDVAQNGYSGWGFMAAYDIKTTADPAPGLSQCASGTASGAATRGQHWTVDTVLTRPSGVTAANLDAWVTRRRSDSPLQHDGAYFIEAEKRFGVNAQYLLAHAIDESAWGTSPMARQKNNLYGFKANDSNPEAAASFRNHQDCILTVAEFVKRNYLTPGGRDYVAPTLKGMNVHYASDPLWSHNIAAIADGMQSM
jgi:Mannosyl-glycoprotein endo-beta-N-acetylglucosaminidase